MIGVHVRSDLAVTMGRNTQLRRSSLQTVQQLARMIA